MLLLYKKRKTLLYLLYNRRNYEKFKNRRYWIHPIVAVRYVEGAFYNLFQKLREDNEKFFNYFRMCVGTFDEILSRISDFICKNDTRMRLSIPPKEMLAVTLRYLASGKTFMDLHYEYRLGSGTISKIVRQVCCSLWDIFKDEYIPLPTRESWRNSANVFAKRANFPNCIGAVDGKHIRVQNFHHNGSINFNYKGFFSIVLMAIADSEYQFLYVDIGGFGKDSDSSIFKESVFYQLYNTGKLNIPPAASLPGRSEKLPFVLIGDQAFKLSTNFLRPYKGTILSAKKRIFNYRLCRARRYVECAFGILCNKWRIFHRPLNVSKHFSRDIVKACIILHNLVRKKDGFRTEDMICEPPGGMQNLQENVGSEYAGKNGEYVRNRFAEYFESAEGALPWQLSKI